MSIENNSTIEQSRNTPKGGEQSIPKGWVETTLGEVVSKIIDYRGKTPKKLGENWSINGKYRALSAKSVKTGGLTNLDQINRVNEILYKKWMRDEIQLNDILMTSEAPMGEVLLWKTDEKIVLSQRLFALRAKDDVSPNYLYYYFISRKFKFELKARASGTTVVGIRQTELIKTKIVIPPLLEQKAIAQILTAFDDKIELLQAQNKTLETTAQTIFKEWFGKYKIGDELPEGWRVGKYGELVNLSSGKGVKKSEYIENGQYEIIGANGLLGRLDKFLINEKVIITGRVGTLGTVYIINKLTWISDNVLISKPIINNSFYFTYFTLKTFDFSTLNTGSTQPLITQSALKSVEIKFPDKLILEKFENLSKPLFKKIKSSNAQIQTLKQTRDTLLPKLMSGQLRVDEFKERAV